MSEANPTEAEQVAERLIGTCMESVQGVCEDLGFDEDEIAEEIDQLCFQCAACGWWCEAGEARENPDGSGEDVCDECHPGEEDD